MATRAALSSGWHPSSQFCTNSRTPSQIPHAGAYLAVRLSDMSVEQRAWSPIGVFRLFLVEQLFPKELALETGGQPAPEKGINKTTYVAEAPEVQRTTVLVAFEYLKSY